MFAYGKGRPINCTNENYIFVYVGRSDQVFTLFNMMCLYVGRGDRVLALINMTCVCEIKSKCLHSLDCLQQLILPVDMVFSASTRFPLPTHTNMNLLMKDLGLPITHTHARY